MVQPTVRITLDSCERREYPGQPFLAGDPWLSEQSIFVVSIAAALVTGTLALVSDQDFSAVIIWLALPLGLGAIISLIHSLIHHSEHAVWIDFYRCMRQKLVTEEKKGQLFSYSVEEVKTDSQGRWELRVLMNGRRRTLFIERLTDETGNERSNIWVQFDRFKLRYDPEHDVIKAEFWGGAILYHYPSFTPRQRRGARRFSTRFSR